MMIHPRSILLCSTTTKYIEENENNICIYKLFYNFLEFIIIIIRHEYFVIFF